MINKAGKIVGIKQLQLHHDSTHPLNSALETLPSTTQNAPYIKNFYKRSFVPSAIGILNYSA